MIKHTTGSAVRKWVLLSALFLLLFLAANILVSNGSIVVAQDGADGSNDGEGAMAITAVSDDPNQLAWVAYWPLNDSAPYNDAIGNHDASCSNCPDSVTGQVNNARDFNGSNDTVNVAANPAFDWSGSDSFSLELWVRADGGSCQGNEVMLGRGSAGAQYWSLGCDGNGRVSFQLSDGTTTTNVLSARTIDNDQWHHLVATHNGSTHLNAVYINGELANSITQSFTGSFASASATIDMGHLAGTRLFAGILDEVAVYEGVLPSLTIKNHYHLVRNYQASCDTVDIMPLGNSITRGFGSSPQPTTFLANYGYRLTLYNSLTAANYDFDFIGSQSHGGISGLPDADHEGHGGLRADQIKNNVAGYLANNPPDVMLLHIGTNDLIQNQTPQNARDDLDGILDIIYQFDPHITVILAQVVAQGSDTFSAIPFQLPIKQVVYEYNALIPPLAQTHVSNGAKIVLVDMFNPLGPPANYADNMYDNVHPNDAGYAKMTPVWFDALDDFLPDCSSPVFDSTPVTETAVNNSYTYQAHANGYPIATYSLQTAPAGMSIDPATGQISWLPNAQQQGSHGVTVIAENSEGTNTHTFTINVKHPVYIPFVIR